MKISIFIQCFDDFSRNIDSDDINYVTYFLRLSKFYLHLLQHDKRPRQYIMTVITYSQHSVVSMPLTGFSS